MSAYYDLLFLFESRNQQSNFRLRHLVPTGVLRSPPPSRCSSREAPSHRLNVCSTAVHRNLLNTLCRFPSALLALVNWSAHPHLCSPFRVVHSLSQAFVRYLYTFSILLITIWIFTIVTYFIIREMTSLMKSKIKPSYLQHVRILLLKIDIIHCTIILSLSIALAIIQTNSLYP